MPTEPTHTPELPQFSTCPFCGQSPHISGVYRVDDDRYYQMHAECCVRMEAVIGWKEYQAIPGVLGPVKLRERLLESWNTRAPSPVTALRSAPGGEHTPLPWRIIADCPYHIFGPERGSGIATTLPDAAQKPTRWLDEASCLSDEANQEYENDPEWKEKRQRELKANAAFIVHAVNNHATLLAALKEIEDLTGEAVENGTEDAQRLNEIIYEIASKATAIAAATREGV